MGPPGVIIQHCLARDSIGCVIDRPWQITLELFPAFAVGVIEAFGTRDGWHHLTACHGGERAAAGPRVHDTFKRAPPPRAPLGEHCFREHRHRSQAPPSVAPAAVGPIAEVSAQSIAIVHEAPAVVAPVAAAPIAEVRVQRIATVHDEPPALLAPTPVAQIAQVSAQASLSCANPQHWSRR